MPLAAEPTVHRARSLIVQRDRSTVDEQMKITAIPAPTGSESARAAYVSERLVALGLGVERDDVGNVLARFGPANPVGERAVGGPVAVVAHLDSVFPEGTPVEVRREGERILAPGITDNARGLAAMISVASVLLDARVPTVRPVIFVATVGEEGSGDLRGMKHLFRPNSALRGAAAVLVVDGAGDRRIVNRAVGATRLRVTVAGPGGHSWADRGRPNPAHALARAIAEIGRLRPPGEGVGYSVNVGRLGGGTSVNSIPAEVWFELDIRADRESALEWLDAEAARIVETAAVGESEQAKGGPRLRSRIERIGSRPTGVLGDDAAIIRVAAAVTRYLGLEPELVASSTDANVPIALGIPAVAIGAGGRAGGIHTIDEWFENHEGARGIERVLLTVLALAGVQGFDPLV